MNSEQYNRLAQAYTAYRLAYPDWLITFLLNGELALSPYNKTYIETENYLSSLSDKELEDLYANYIKAYIPKDGGLNKMVNKDIIVSTLAYYRTYGSINTYDFNLRVLTNPRKHFSGSKQGSVDYIERVNQLHELDTYELADILDWELYKLRNDPLGKAMVYMFNRLLNYYTGVKEGLSKNTQYRLFIGDCYANPDCQSYQDMLSYLRTMDDQQLSDAYEHTKAFIVYKWF